MSDSLNEKWMKLPKRFRVSVVYSAMIIFWLVVLNVLTSRYPWCMYAVFGLLWWPLSAYFVGRRQPLLYALCATALLALFFLFIYLFTSFGAHPWFIYPMLGVFWWPLGVWGAKAGAKKFSVVGAEYVVLMMLMINLLTSPHYWWWIYPTLAVIWWPLGVYLHGLNHKDGESQ